MIERKKWRVSCLISVIFVIFIGTLVGLSVFMHCATNIYDQSKTIENHTPYLYVGMTIIEIGLIIFLCSFFESHFSLREWEKASKIIVYFCGGVIVLAGIFWIYFNDSAPMYDQKTVFLEAQRIAGFLDEPYDRGYFALFHRNRGITLVVSIALKLFGNHFYSFYIFNLVAAVVIYYSICRTSAVIFKNPVITVITAMFLVLFYPLIAYVTYVYGTLLSVACTSFGLYAAIELCEKQKLRYGIYLIFVFPFGILMHQSAAIGLIAATIYILTKSRGRTLVRNLLIFFLSVVMIFISTKAVDIIYTSITGTDPKAPAVPASCTIYMGLTSDAESGGPGSQDGSYVEIYMDNNRDAGAANRDAFHRIGMVMKEYLTGERDCIFFLKKTEYQWLDPSFGAWKIITLDADDALKVPVSGAYAAFYYSSLRKAFFKVTISYMLLVYVGALAAGIKSIRNGKEYPLIILLQIYVMGGGTFQMLWESLSRYCFGYFLWLIPMGVYGLYSIYQEISKRVVFSIRNIP